MAAGAGYRAQLLLAGASTEALDEPCTGLTSTVFQVTNAAKRLLDADVEVVVYDNGVEADPADYTLNYLYGKITFLVAPTGPVTVDINYLPLSEACSVRGVTLTIEREVLDETTFCTAEEDAGGRRTKMGLRSVAVAINSVDPMYSDVRGDFFTLLGKTDDIPGVLEYWPNRNVNASYRVRGFVFSDEDSGEVEGLVTSSISFTASQYNGSGAIARSQD